MNSNLATAIRTIVVLILAWGVVFLTKGTGGISAITPRSWLFLGEAVTWKTILGSILLLAGTLIMVL